MYPDNRRLNPLISNNIGARLLNAFWNAGTQQNLLVSLNWAVLQDAVEEEAHGIVDSATESASC